MKLNIAVANLALLVFTSRTEVKVEGYMNLHKTNILSRGNLAFHHEHEHEHYVYYLEHAHDSLQTTQNNKNDPKQRQRLNTLQLFMSNYGNNKSREEDEDDDDDEGKSIEELYERAMIEDEEWYNHFVRDVLGEELETKINDNRNAEAGVGVETKEKNKWKDDRKEKEEQAPVLASASTSTQEKEKESETKESKLNIDNDGNGQHQNSDKYDTEKEEEAKNNGQGKEDDNDEDDDGTLVQYTDMYDNIQRIPMSTLSKLGYEMKDIIRLQSGVLELIVEDQMPMPQNGNGNGLPKRWLVEGRDQREVKILKKRKQNQNQDQRQRQAHKVNFDGENIGDGRRRAPDGRRKRSSINSRGDARSERQRSMRYRRNGQRRGRRGGTGDSTESGRARNTDSRYDSENESESSSLWMDIPTFKQYLRREADLRLSILGPEWEDWVKGESDWRLNLYKGWLGLVENGVGDDLFEDLSYVPASERQRDVGVRTRIKKSGGSRRPSERIEREYLEPAETGRDRTPRSRPNSRPRRARKDGDVRLGRGRQNYYDSEDRARSRSGSSREGLNPDRPRDTRRGRVATSGGDRSRRSRESAYNINIDANDGRGKHMSANDENERRDRSENLRGDGDGASSFAGRRPNSRQMPRDEPRPRSRRRRMARQEEGFTNRPSGKDMGYSRDTDNEYDDDDDIEETEYNNRRKRIARGNNANNSGRISRRGDRYDESDLF